MSIEREITAMSHKKKILSGLFDLDMVKCLIKKELYFGAVFMNVQVY